MKARPYNLIFISAESSTRTVEENDAANQRLGQALELLGLTHEKVEGKYNGLNEVAYVIKVAPLLDDVLPIARYLAFTMFQQDAILLVDTQNQATMMYHSGKEEYIGTWTNVTGLHSQADYDRVGDYTKIGERYFSAL